MLLLAPLVLVGPGLLLAEALVGLAGHGPLGWLAGLLMVAVVAAVSGWVVARARRWWASTKAPVRGS